MRNENKVLSVYSVPLLYMRNSNQTSCRDKRERKNTFPFPYVRHQQAYMSSSGRLLMASSFSLSMARVYFSMCFRPLWPRMLDTVLMLAPLLSRLTAQEWRAHGSRHEYVLVCRTASHPITEGLPARWKHASDELYDRMRGPGGIKDLLYTAFSSPEQRGSGREEPLIFTVEYGKGRIFHIMLGHCGNSLDDNPAMQCAGFQTLLLRGAEWCATGKVSQPVPKDFPTADRVSLRSNYRPEE